MTTDLGDLAMLILVALMGVALGTRRRRALRLAAALSPFVVVALLALLLVGSRLVGATCEGDFIDGPYECAPGGDEVAGVFFLGVFAGMLTLPLSVGALIGMAIRRLRHRRVAGTPLRL